MFLGADILEVMRFPRESLYHKLSDIRKKNKAGTQLFLETSD